MFFYKKAFSRITPLQPTTLANLSIYNPQRTTSTILTLGLYILSSYLLKSRMPSTASIPNILFNSFVNSATNCNSNCHIQEWWTCFFLLFFYYLSFSYFSFSLSFFLLFILDLAKREQCNITHDCHIYCHNII